MTFFNKKEEVLNIEITPYGKYLLSKGKFIPAYYEFYDDDIIYDSQFGNYSETQGQIQQRIKETPRIKAQYSFESAETRYKQYREQTRLREGEVVEILETRNNFSLSSLPLANVNLDSEFSPSITMKLLSGEIESSRFLDSKGMMKNIVEFDARTINTEVTVRKKRAEEPATLEAEGNSFQIVEIGEEEIEVRKKDGYLLIDLEESGVPLRGDNFEIFIYEIEKSGSTVIGERPLKFNKERNNVRDGILYDYDEIELRPFKDTEDYAEYYFSILKDKEIPQEILCKYLDEEEIEKLRATDGYNINCAGRRFSRAVSPELLIADETEQPEEC